MTDDDTSEYPSAAEMVEAWKKRSEELERIVCVKDGHIVINVLFEYDIDLRRCATHAEILAWTFHLAEKTWMTPEIIRQFVRVALREAGLKMPNP